MSVPRADPAEHAAIKYALDLKLAEFSYRPVLPSFSGKSLLKWRFEEQNPRIASAKIIGTRMHKDFSNDLPANEGKTGRYENSANFKSKAYLIAA